MHKILILVAFTAALASGLAPARAVDLTSIGDLDPKDLGDLIDDIVDDGDLAQVLPQPHGGYRGRTKEQVLIAGLNFAIARQVYCLAYSQPEPGWEANGPADLQRLVDQKNVVVDFLRTFDGEKKDRPNLGFTLALGSAASPELVRPSSQYPWRVRITSLPFRFGWRDPNWAGFPHRDDQLDAAGAGWGAIQRTVIHELAHAAVLQPGHIHGETWQEMERFLWHLWAERCRELADFGDADPAKYPTRLFPDPKDFWKQDPEYLLSANLALARPERLGAHHLQTDLAWLGRSPRDRHVDRENDARSPRDRFDDGIAGNAFAGQLRTVVSVADRDDAAFTDGGFLVLHGWIDWDRRKGWNDRQPEHLVWRTVTGAGGAPAPGADLVARNVPGRPTEPTWSVVLHPDQWPANTQQITLTFAAPRGKKAGGFARFRLYFFAGDKAFRDAVFSTSGRFPSGEVEDYQLSEEEIGEDGTTIHEEGDFVCLPDPIGDFYRHTSGTVASAPGGSDIRDADVTITAPSGGPWTDFCIPLPGTDPDDCGRRLTLDLELHEPVAAEPDALFASWHFVVDLDGRRGTGHPGGEPPVGVFPDLGIDLWADVIWDGHGFRPYLFLGPEDIRYLRETPGLLEVRPDAGRRKVRFEVPVAPVEEILAELYGPDFAIDEEAIEWVAVTNHVSAPIDFEDPPSDFFPDWLYLPEGSCERAEREGTALCLNGGRFRVEVEWATGAGDRGIGRPVPLTDETGYFWFFHPDNVELVIKALDACDFSNRFWIFAGGLTDVEVEITVTDTMTGEVRRYRNPQGVPFAPILDTSAFATCDAAPDGPKLAPPTDDDATVAPEPSPLALGGGRFEVEVAWETAQGSRGFGQGVQLTDDTGYYWFFHPDNVELVIKVLDACSPFDRFWVFAGGLTDVEVEITVTDTETGEVRRYHSPAGRPFAPILDTSAFASCR